MAASLVVILLACAASWVARCMFASVKLVTTALSSAFALASFAKAYLMPTRLLAM